MNVKLPLKGEEFPNVPGSNVRTFLVPTFLLLLTSLQCSTLPQPPAVDSGGLYGSVAPPSDATVLFDGSDLSAWATRDGAPAGWHVENGYVEIRPGTGSIVTREHFGDVQLHLEWATPAPPRGSGQRRGNSGVFLMSRYEVQVLDSYGSRTYPQGQAASIYGQHPPLVNASRPPGEWQVYDIVFRRPRFDENGAVLEPARMTVLHNGVLVHDNAVVRGATGYLRRGYYTAHAEEQPLLLQDHGARVRYRNIWIRRLSDRGPLN